MAKFILPYIVWTIIYFYFSEILLYRIIFEAKTVVLIIIFLLEKNDKI